MPQTVAGARALDRGVAVEVLEVVERPLLQALEDRAVVLVRGARAELVEAVADAAFEIGDHAAEMVRDDREAGIGSMMPENTKRASVTLVS